MGDAKLTLRKEIGLAYLRTLRCAALRSEPENQCVIIGQELWGILKDLGLTTPEVLESLDLTISDTKKEADDETTGIA